MPNDRTRVLVVDDSLLMRRLLADLIESDPRFVVVGTARDGSDALAKLVELSPDVVTLDIEMPVMDGLSALARIMERQPTPVVMLSSRTRHGAEETLRSLELGAIDFVCKPSGSVSADIGKVRDMLLTKLRLAAIARVLPGVPPARPFPAPRRRPAGGPADGVVVIGSSTGGPRALDEVIPRLPGDLGAGVLIAQHMPAGFTAAMAARLDALSAVEVREADDGDSILGGRVLVAPGGRHLVVTRQGRAAVTADPPVWGVRPAADLLFESAARAYGSRCVGVVLTGMGQDGTSGLRAVREAGGRTLAQDEATCVVYGMPKAAVEAGAVELQAPLPDIAKAIARLLADRRGSER